MMTVVSILELLAENAGLIETILDALRAGTPADAINAAVIAAKVATSDVALKEELGVR